MLTFCAPAHAEHENNLPTNFIMKQVRVLCSSMESFLDYADTNGYRIHFMGETVTPGVQDMIFLKENNEEFLIMRFLQMNQEACMVSNGTPTFFEK